MAYSDNDEAASAAAAGESKFIQCPKNPLYTVKVKIKEEYEIDNCINRNKNEHIISENYGERTVEVDFTSKEPKLAKLKIRLTPLKKKTKKKKKGKTKKEVYANVTENISKNENHDYKIKLIDNTVKSEAEIKEENHEPEIKLEDIIKMEADDLDPLMFMDTSDERSSKNECDQCEKVYHSTSELREHIKAGYIFLFLRNKYLN